jgi:hypothetical protein
MNVLPRQPAGPARAGPGTTTGTGAGAGAGAGAGVGGQAYRPQNAIPLESESVRRKRKYREVVREVAPGLELEEGVDEVSAGLRV